MEQWVFCYNEPAKLAIGWMKPVGKLYLSKLILCIMHVVLSIYDSWVLCFLVFILFYTPCPVVSPMMYWLVHLELIYREDCRVAYVFAAMPVILSVMLIATAYCILVCLLVAIRTVCGHQEQLMMIVMLIVNWGQSPRIECIYGFVAMIRVGSDAAESHLLHWVISFVAATEVISSQAYSLQSGNHREMRFVLLSPVLPGRYSRVASRAILDALPLWLSL